MALQFISIEIHYIIHILVELSYFVFDSSTYF